MTNLSLRLAVAFAGLLLFSGAPQADTAVRSFDSTHGRVSYTDAGEGALVVLVPGAEQAGEFRYVVPQLVEAGFRVVILASSVTLESSGGSARAASVGADVVELIRHLGQGPAYLAGSASTAGAVAWATAVAPEQVRGLMLLGPSIAETAQAPASHARTLVLMGDSDPAFVAPKVEADAVARRVNGQVRMVEKAGSLPHVDAPGSVGPAMIRFMDRLDS